MPTLLPFPFFPCFGTLIRRRGRCPAALPPDGPCYRTVHNQEHHCKNYTRRARHALYGLAPFALRRAATSQAPPQTPARACGTRWRPYPRL